MADAGYCLPVRRPAPTKSFSRAGSSALLHVDGDLTPIARPIGRDDDGQHTLVERRLERVEARVRRQRHDLVEPPAAAPGVAHDGALRELLRPFAVDDELALGDRHRDLLT